MPVNRFNPLPEDTQEWLANRLILVSSVLAPLIAGLLIYRGYLGILDPALAGLSILLIPFVVLGPIRYRLSLKTKSCIIVSVFTLPAVATLWVSGLLGIGPLLSLLASFSAVVFFGQRAFLISMLFTFVALCTAGFAHMNGQLSLATDLSEPINVWGRLLTLTAIHGILLSGVCGVVFTISQQTNLATSNNHRLEKTVDELNSLIESANAPIFGIDNHGCINEWNGMAAKITGYSKRDVVGHDLVNTYITDEYKASVAKVLERALAGRNTANYEFPLYSKTGERIDILLNAATRRDADGAIIGVMGVGQDVTGFLKQKRLLRQAQKMEAIGLLTGGIAHDFNNLLTVISGNLEVAIEKIEKTGEQLSLKGLLGDAAAASADAAYLTSQLLSFASQQSLKLDHANLRDLLSEVLRKTFHPLPSRIKCSAEIDRVDTVALVDHVLLENAMVNLVNNARDAIEDMGNISVEAHTEHFGDKAAAAYSLPVGEYVVITVHDDGCGMSKDLLQKVTEPFFTTKAIGRGAGLGLSMVNGFTSQLGGGMYIESGEDVGTSVRLVIPLVQRNLDSPQEAEVQRSVGLQRPGTVLVVEDEPRLRNLVVRQLSTSGFKVLEAEDAGQALETLATDGGEIDTLFSDVRMPGELSGRELAATVSQLYPSVRLLLTSGYEPAAPASPDQSRSPAWNIPMLRKPYSREELIDALLDLPSRTREA